MMKDQIVVPVARQRRAGRPVAGAVGHVREALKSGQDNFAIGLAAEGEMRFLDEVEEVVVPDVHLDDAAQVISYSLS